MPGFRNLLAFRVAHQEIFKGDARPLACAAVAIRLPRRSIIDEGGLEGGIICQRVRRIVCHERVKLGDRFLRFVVFVHGHRQPVMHPRAMGCVAPVREHCFQHLPRVLALRQAAPILIAFGTAPLVVLHHPLDDTKLGLERIRKKVGRREFVDHLLGGFEGVGVLAIAGVKLRDLKLRSRRQRRVGALLDSTLQFFDRFILLALQDVALRLVKKRSRRIGGLRVESNRTDQREAERKGPAQNSYGAWGNGGGSTEFVGSKPERELTSVVVFLTVMFAFFP